MGKIRQTQYGQLFFLLFSTIVGTVITNVCLKRDFDFSCLDLSVFSGSFITWQSAKARAGAIIFKRFKQMAVVLLLIKVFRPDRVLSGILVLFGGMFGVLLTVQCYYMGLYGVFLILFALLPQFVLYYISLRTVREYIRAGVNRELKLKYLFFFCLFFATGLFCEIIFLEKIFTRFYQYMVTM